MKSIKGIWPILLALAVVCGGVAAGIILTRGGGGGAAYATYSNYGFSIEYDKGMEIHEEGMNDGVPDDNSGLVGGVKEDGTQEGFAVVWMRTEAAVNVSELGDALDFARGMLFDPFVTFVEVGAWEYGTKAGHDMAYQSFTLMVYGETVHGVWGAWYCDQNERIYILWVGSTGEATGMWQRYLDSFVCH